MRYPAAHLDVSLLILPWRDTLVRQIRDSHQHLCQLTLYSAELSLKCLESDWDGLRFSHDSTRIFALCFKRTNLLGQRIALGLQVLGFSLNRLASGLKRIEMIRIKCEATASQAGNHKS